MDALALLRLQIEWGADEALEDAPVDRLRANLSSVPATLRPAPASPSGPAPALPPPLTPGVALGTPAERAAAAAGRARNVDELRAALAAFDGCALRDTAANLVFAAGEPDADLMLIGEHPGEAEDRSGAPFAGPDGALLDRMLASVGLARDGLLLTPLIPWRPPGGRLPNPAEIAVCLPFLHRLITLAGPRRVVLAGAVAARALIGPVRRRAGPTWTELPVPGVSAPIPALVMPSPGMVARTASARREAWAALRLLRRTLDTDLAKK